ncbi:MAG TPA: hypothetical protein VL326_24740 [Kofleriaceae bacterium]|nr:hypothetical protein [Kofleriaceae bacterium]
MTSDQCRLGDEVGYCEDSGYCTFADTTCDSQRRYDETAEFPLADECLTGYVTGHIAERFIVNDDTGAPTLMTRSPAMLAVAAVLDDGSLPTVRFDHDGAFSFAAPPGAHYQLAMPVLGVFQGSVPHIEAASLMPERPDVVRSTKPTSIHFAYNQNPLGNLWIASTGAYTETFTTTTATTFNFDWFTANAGGPKAALLNSAANDRLYVNQTAIIGGYVSIVASATEQLTLVDGMTAMAAGQLTPTIRDGCVQLRTNATAEQMRMKTAEATLATMTSSWRLTAAQARDQTENQAFKLADHPDATPTNASLDVTFSNPFPGTTTLAQMSVDGTYNIAAGGFNVPAGMWSRVYQPFDSHGGSCSATANLSGATAIGGAAVVAGTQVDANDKLVTADLTKPVPIAWSQVVSGVAHYWTIVLWEVSDDGAGGLVFEIKFGFSTPDDHALLPKTLLVSGHTYILQIAAVQGVPNAGQGDFVTHTYPSGSTGAWSKSFKIK